MKANFYKTMFFSFIAAGLLSACVKDDEDTSLPNYTPVIFGEDFETNAVDNTILATPGWTNFAEVGSMKWKIQEFDSFYAEFSPFVSSPPPPGAESVNIGWLISPTITLGTHPNERLVFQSSQSFVSNPANTLEVLISTNFDGTNVTAATWQPLEATFPTTATEYYLFVNSGEIDLSQYSGKANIAFRYTGSTSNTQLDGSYQVDFVRVIY